MNEVQMYIVGTYISYM